MRPWSICLIAAMIFQPWPATAVAAGMRDAGDAAHLFAYWPKEGQEERFDEAYRKHLEWHRARRDPLVWYGWYVSSGDRVGMFIDGSFGAPFAAFDQRVAPKEDAADAARTFSPLATDAFRSSYRLRRELSTGFPLEQWNPSKSVQVFHYVLHPGTKQRFENVLRAARGVVAGMEGAPAFTSYELVAGGDVPGYMLMVARDGWAGHEGFPGDLERLLERVPGAGKLRDDLLASVREARTETWNYREDLSLIPED